GVILRDYKRSSDQANSKPKRQKRMVTVGKSDSGHGKGIKHKQCGIGPAWAKAITQPPSEKPGQDCEKHRRDYSVSDLSLGELQIVTNNRHQRRDSKPRQETQEERKPRNMEGAHRRA